MLLGVALAFEELPEVSQVVRERRAPIFFKGVFQARGPALGLLDQFVQHRLGGRPVGSRAEPAFPDPVLVAEAAPPLLGFRLALSGSGIGCQDRFCRGWPFSVQRIFPGPSRGRLTHSYLVPARTSSIPPGKSPRRYPMTGHISRTSCGWTVLRLFVRNPAGRRTHLPLPDASPFDAGRRRSTIAGRCANRRTQFRCQRTGGRPEPQLPPSRYSVTPQRSNAAIKSRSLKGCPPPTHHRADPARFPPSPVFASFPSLHHQEATRTALHHFASFLPS